MVRLSVLTLMIVWFFAVEPARAVPLFDSEVPLEIVIKSDFPYASYFGKNLSDVKKPKYAAKILYKYSGKVRHVNASQQARGSGRLDHCRFAPFKLGIQQPDFLFAGISKEIKVVTHCQYLGSAQENERQIIKEYATYKMIEALGLPAFKARLVKIHYFTNKDLKIATRYAFFIEPKSNLLARDSRLAKAFHEDETEQLLVQKFGSNYEAKLKSGRLRESDLKDFFNRLIDLDWYIARSLGQRLILNDDWGGVIESGNVQAMYLKSGKTTGVHYDFDLSELVGKFSAFNPDARSLLLQDIKWVHDFCTKEASDDSGLISIPQKKTRCKFVLRSLATRELAVLKAIEDVPLLSAQDKAPLLLRSKIFFHAIKTVESRL